MEKEDLFKRKDKYPIISSKQLKDAMGKEIEPYLKKRQETFRLRGKDQNVIAGSYYRADDEKGTILISHGFTESQFKFREMIYYFLKEGYNVCIFDHRNHGYSRNEYVNGPTHIDRFQQYVDDLEIVVEKEFKHVSGPHYLYCHSMGGLIGATYVLQHPDTFDKVVLSSPLFEVNRGGVPYFMAKGIASILCLFGKGNQYLPGQGTFDAHENFEGSASSCFERYIEYFKCQVKDKNLQNNGSSNRWAYEVFKACEKMRKDCKQIQVPILLFQAEKDDFVLPEAQDHFISSIPNGKMIYVKRAKHEIYLSDDETVGYYVQAIFDFLKC